MRLTSVVPNAQKAPQLTEDCRFQKTLLQYFVDDELDDLKKKNGISQPLCGVDRRKLFD